MNTPDLFAGLEPGSAMLASWVVEGNLIVRDGTALALPRHP